MLGDDGSKRTRTQEFCHKMTVTHNSKYSLVVFVMISI